MCGTAHGPPPVCPHSPQSSGESQSPRLSETCNEQGWMQSSSALLPGFSPPIRQWPTSPTSQAACFQLLSSSTSRDSTPSYVTVSFSRFLEGGLRAHQRSLKLVQQCVWCYACGNLCLPEAARSSQLHHGGLFRGKRGAGQGLVSPLIPSPGLFAQAHSTG